MNSCRQERGGGGGVEGVNQAREQQQGGRVAVSSDQAGGGGSGSRSKQAEAGASGQARLDEAWAAVGLGPAQVCLCKSRVGEAGDAPGAQLAAREEADVAKVPGAKTAT